MIFDSLNNFNNYLSINENFKHVSNFLSENSLDNLEIKRYELPDGNYTFVNSYQTKQVSESFIECHRKFIDVQVMISGSEKIGVCNINDCAEGEYNPDKEFSTLKGDVDFITLKEGQFAVFFPQDGHMPGISINNNPQSVKKLVFKIVV